MRQDGLRPILLWYSTKNPYSQPSARVSIAASSLTAKRYESLMDIEQVDFLIKKVYESTYFPISGGAYDQIMIGGSTGNAPIPGYITNSAGIQNIGSWSRTDIEPFAYSEHPYDDFYFTDFITRIHKDDPMDGDEAMLSYCPMSTRYNDGRYHIKARVTDVRNGFTDSPVQNVVIDDYPQNILNGKYYVLKCLRYLTLSEFYFFFLQYTHDCRSARRWCSGCLNMRARVGIITVILFWR